MKNYTQTKRKLTYKTCTIFRVLQANERQSGRRLEATGKVAHVASVSVCFRSKDEERDFLREKNGTRCKKGREGEGSFLPFFYSRHFRYALWLSILALFSETARKRLPRRLQGKERGKKWCNYIFFLLFTLLLGTRLSPGSARPKTRKKKRGNEQRGSPSEKRRHRAGTFPQPLPFSGLFRYWYSRSNTPTHPPTPKKR